MRMVAQIALNRHLGSRIHNGSSWEVSVILSNTDHRLSVENVMASKITTGANFPQVDIKLLSLSGTASVNGSAVTSEMASRMCASDPGVIQTISTQNEINPASM